MGGCGWEFGFGGGVGGSVRKREVEALPHHKWEGRGGMKFFLTVPSFKCIQYLRFKATSRPKK